MPNQRSIFNNVLTLLRKGRRGRELPSPKQVLTGSPPVVQAQSGLEDKQQAFLDIQYQKIAHDLYSRSVYYDTDRIGAYNDYRAMDMSPEISAALDIIADECLEASTVIPLANGQEKTIEELYIENAQNFEVFGVDTDNKSTSVVNCERVVFKGEQNVYKVVFANDSYLMATENHLWLRDDTNIYAETSKLRKGDRLQPLFLDENEHCIKTAEERLQIWKNENKNTIKSIEFVGKRKTYDLVNTGKDHNYASYRFNDRNKIGIVSHNCVTRSEKGDILAVYSQNNRVKKILKDLFVNVLNSDFNLFYWIRELCKFGDTFLLLEVDRQQGVFDCRALPVAEIHREEAYDGNMNSARFRWDINNMYFEEWQVAHFRLVSDGTKMPYGRSILDSCRKLWKQLQLAEDAMLIYRILRAPDRRVYYIEVGNVDTADIPAYIEKVKRDLKKQPIVDSKTGNMNLKYNPQPVWKKTPIPLLDGRTITIEELAKEYDEGKENYVYSVQDKTHKIVPGKVVWCGKNYTAKKLTKVWLDDNTWVMTAPEHPFVLIDGGKARADELKRGDSLMPFYEGVGLIFDEYEYKTVYDPHSGKFNFVHRIVAESVKGKGKNKRTIHHKNFQKFDNAPANLVWINFDKHRDYHSKHLSRLWQSEEYRKMKSETTTIANRKRNSVKAMAWYNSSDLHKEHDKIRSEKVTKIWKNKAKRKQWSDAMKIKTNKKCFEIMVDEIQKYNEFITTDNFALSLLNTEMYRELKKLNLNTKRDLSKFFIRKNIRRILRENGIDNYEEFLEKYNPVLLVKKREMYSEQTTKMNIARHNQEEQFEYKNHKVLRIEEVIVDGEDVYCMTVVGLNDEDDRHNFALYSLIGDVLEAKPSESGVYVGNTIEEDFFIPVRGDKGSRVETLAGACLALDTNVELLDGRSLQLQNIIKEFEEGKELWSYSVNPKTGEIVPGLITWAGVTRKDTDVVKITLDNGETIIATPDHKFPTKFNGIKEAKEAKDLLPEETMWGFNKEIESKNSNDHISCKIVSVEFLSEKMDTGTITIDGDEKYHNFHNFALSCGVFTNNSNMADIEDVEYLQNKLFAALKVPKTYLNYSEALPGGSTLSQADLRFSRTINRIQEAVLMELRRVANIHLHFLGFDDDLDNFTLSLTNPSTQQELLKLETMKLRLEVFKEMFTADAHSPVSYVWAMENILGFSKMDIKQILRQKKIEKKMFAEIDQAVEEYLETGMFAELDDKFRKPGYIPSEATPAPSEGEEEAGGGMEAFGGGSSVSPGESLLGGPEMAGGPEALEAGAGPGAEAGAMGAEAGAGGGGEAGPLAESEKGFNLLFEENNNQNTVLINKNNKLNAITRNLLKNIDAKIAKVSDKEDKK